MDPNGGSVADFVTVNLALNAGRLKDVRGLGVADDVAECNPGGSIICTTGTKGCDAGLTCVGTSTKMDDCGFGSAVKFVA